jgi:hypothetical protein
MVLPSHFTEAYQAPQANSSSLKLRLKTWIWWIWNAPGIGDTFLTLRPQAQMHMKTPCDWWGPQRLENDMAMPRALLPALLIFQGKLGIRFVFEISGSLNVGRDLCVSLSISFFLFYYGPLVWNFISHAYPLCTSRDLWRMWTVWNNPNYLYI